MFQAGLCATCPALGLVVADGAPHEAASRIDRDHREDVDEDG